MNELIKIKKPPLWRFFLLGKDDYYANALAIRPMASLIFSTEAA